MNRYTRLGVCAALPVLVATGCADWLTGTGLTDDPNRPTAVTPELLLVGVTAAQATIQTGGLARTAGMWTQQFAGVDRQYITLDRYGLSEADFTAEWSQTYLGGGLVDIREIQERVQDDPLYLGIAQVWEALAVGTAASTWGDIPYREAINPAIETPDLDPQEQVYADLQALLADAIANIDAGGDGPGVADLIYGGNPAQWREAAHTLKARLYMHWAQAQLEGNPAAATACGGDCLVNARNATLEGISVPANNFRLWAASIPGQENIWFQFMFRERDSYMRTGSTMIDLLNARNDPRRDDWLAAPFIGAPPGGPGGTTLNPLARGGAGFRQPIITYGENILLRAEAEALMGNPGPAGAALSEYRTTAGLAAVPLQGATLLEQIYEELYLALFQNIEVWNMYKRSCYPNVPLPAAPLRSSMPRRMFYGSDERNVNPNIPAPGTYPLFTTFDHEGGTLHGPGVCVNMPTGN